MTLAGDVDGRKGSVLFIGTATVLIRYAGFTILTDPNFLHRGEHAPLGYGLRSKRLTDPALEIGQLPPLDLVVLSHFHGDHFDPVAERELDKAIPVITTRHAAASLKQRGFRAAEALAMWESHSVAKNGARLSITAMPGKHAPGILSRVLPPVMGSLLEFTSRAGARLSLYITGDTLIHDALNEIPRRYPHIDLGLLHLGGTRVLGLTVTMDARQGVEALRRIGPRTAIPIHYNDYGAFKSPLSDFRNAVAAAGLTDRVHYLAHGDTYEFTVPAP